MASSMRQQFAVFVVRWLLNSVGIWVGVTLLGHARESMNVTTAIITFVVAGLIFSIINSVLKPIIMILSLPAILLTLGLFTLVVNGFLVYISLALAPGLSMSFGDSVLAGIILSLVNYIISSALDLKVAAQDKEM